MVRWLVEAGADVNSPMGSQYVPLFLAAKNGHIGVARFLLDNGANINATDDKDEEAGAWDFVRYAVQSGVLEMALLPLDYGVSPDIYLRSYIGYTDAYPREYRHKLVRTLIDKGMNVRGHQLFSVVWDNDISTTKMLVGGASVCLKSNGKTAYQEARARGYQEIADYLASQGGADCPDGD